MTIKRAIGLLDQPVDEQKSWDLHRDPIRWCQDPPGRILTRSNFRFQKHCSLELFKRNFESSTFQKALLQFVHKEFYGPSVYLSFYVFW